MRAALLIDGTYFYIINNYYGSVSRHKRSFEIPLLIQYFQKVIAKALKEKVDDIEFLHGHLYIGVRDSEINRFQSEEMVEYGDAGIVTHVSPLITHPDGKSREKGVDTSLVADGTEWISRDEIDVLVLIAGDADFIPLVRKSKKFKKNIFLFYWNINLGKDYKEDISTSGKLVEELEMTPEQKCVSLAINMERVIEKKKPNIFKQGLGFVHKGTILGKRGSQILIRPSSYGDTKEYTEKEGEGFTVGQSVKYRIEEGEIFDLKPV
ncbi:MAG: NYN domain-containing protein [Candidatus Paceibacterota bacterium]